MLDGRDVRPPSECCQALHQCVGLPEHLDDLVFRPVLEGADGDFAFDLILVKTAGVQRWSGRRITRWLRFIRRFADMAWRRMSIRSPRDPASGSIPI